MRKTRLVAAAVSALVILSASPAPPARALAPALVLNPSSGEAPTVAGSLRGSGWLCESGAAPAGGAAVSGEGVAGSATINRDGSLSGSFTVRGDPGQRVEVEVTANTSCPGGRSPVFLGGTAVFTFNEAPTATARPTDTPPPTATRPPTSTPTPEPTATPRPTSTPEPSPTPEPTSTPEPSPTTEPTVLPEPTRAPTQVPTAVPTDAPRPTLPPEPTTPPEPTAVPTPETDPEPNAVPTSTAAPQRAAAATATVVLGPSPTQSRAAVVSSTPTAAVRPGATATSRATTPTLLLTATPSRGVPESQGSLQIVGCALEASRVHVEFQPLGMLASGGARSGAPSGASIRVSTTSASNAPGTLLFQPPPTLDAGRIYRVSAIVDDPQCALEPGSTSQFWLAGAGKEVRLPLVAPGDSRLEVSNNGEDPPKPLAVVKGAFVEFGRPPRYSEVIAPDQFDGWETQIDFYGSVKDRKQRFRWSTDILTADAAVLQVGILPFSTGYEASPLSPPGVLASWPVDCVSCEFVVDLSPLPAPEPEAALSASMPDSSSLLEKAGQVISSVLNAIGDFFANVTKGLAGLFGGAQDPPAESVDKLVAIEVPSSKVTVASPYLAGNSAAGPVKPPTFTTFYFRVLPLQDGDPAGGGSNAVVMNWAGDSPPEINVSIVITPTPVPSPSAYEVEILSYHGVIPPIDKCDYGDYGDGYVVLQDAWLVTSPGKIAYTTKPVAGSPPTLKKGEVICEPAPEEPSLWEKIGDWASGAWNWVSEAYSDLKAFAVDVILNFTPLGLQCQVIASQVGDSGICEKVFATGLDAALVTMGIPPDLPNLDQLMDQGMDYVASYMTEQAMAQVGVPPELTEGLTGLALEEAKEKFRAELEAKIKQGLQEGVTQIQLSYADSTGWLPKGVPVRPNDYQPAGMSIKVSRKSGVPGGEDGCTAKISDSLTIDQSKLASIPPGYANPFAELNKKQALVPGKYYDLFKDLSLPVPQLKQGTSVTIPVSFQPNVYQSGWNPLGTVQTTDYFYAWGFLHMLGDVQINVHGCGSDELEVAADGTYGPQ